MTAKRQSRRRRQECPVLFFGSIKVNNSFDIVDAVGKEDDQGMTATIFAKIGDEYIRVVSD